MQYTMFSQKKLELTGLINSVQLQQVQRSDEQLALSARTITLQSTITNLQASHSASLGALYEQLATVTDSTDRQAITDAIEYEQSKNEGRIAQINQQIYQVSVQENAIEMEIKRLDTKLTAMKKQLEKIEEAEKEGIEKSVPQFNGLG
mgnify:CR=1 FL=1